MEYLKGLKGKHLMEQIYLKNFKVREVAEFLDKNPTSLKSQYSTWKRNHSWKLTKKVNSEDPKDIFTSKTDREIINQNTLDEIKNLKSKVAQLQKQNKELILKITTQTQISEQVQNPEIPTSEILNITNLIKHVTKLSNNDQQNMIYKRFLKRSDPDSKSYREYLDILSIINDFQR